jgi:subtilase family serine protease
MVATAQVRNSPNYISEVHASKKRISPMNKEIACIIIFCVLGLGGLYAIPFALNQLHDYSAASSFDQISNTVVPFPTGFNVTGGVPSDMQMNASVGLTSNNEQLFEQTALSTVTPGSPDYHHYLTHAQIMNEFGPSPSVYSSVWNYLASQGLKVFPGVDNFSIDISGTASQMESAFSTSIVFATNGLIVYYGNTQDVSVPSNIAPYISSVIGLENITQFQPALTLSPAYSGESIQQALANGPTQLAPTQPPYTPQSTELAYNTTGVYNKCITCAGSYMTVAVVDAYGDPTAEQDLAAYDASFFDGNIPQFSILYPYGQPSISGTANAVVTLWEVETALDIQMANGMAPGNTSTIPFTQGANIISVVSPDPAITLVQSVAYVIANNLANVISQSWGEADLEAGPFITYTHVYYVMAAAEGITVLAASGDSGAVAPGANFVDTSWPASDTFVIGVGGTSLIMKGTDTGVNCELCGPPTMDEITNPTSWENETAWEGYSGGGYSPVFARPAWQEGFGVNVSEGRGVPDISADGMFMGNDFYFNGQPAGSYLFGGTSFASPLVAGMIATLDSYLFVQGPLGFLDPVFYQILNSPYYHSGFHDIVNGWNDGPPGPGNGGLPYYYNHPGWDPVNGIGSLNVGELAGLLNMYSFSAGAWIGSSSIINYGAQVQIQTIIPTEQSYGGVSLFYVRESLSNGATLYVGYSEATPYSLFGVDSWFYGWIPAGALFGTSYFTFGPTGSAGINGTINTYAITATNGGKTWDFEFNGKVLGSYGANTALKASSPMALASAFGVTNTFNIVGPAAFKNLAIQSSIGSKFGNLKHGYFIQLTQPLDAGSPTSVLPNPYSAKELKGADNFLAGSVEPVLINGTELW